MLSLFDLKDYHKSTLLPSEALVKILALLEKDLAWVDQDQVLSGKQLDSSLSADLVFLSGKMLKEHSAAMMAKIFGQLSKPLPTLGLST